MDPGANETVFGPTVAEMPCTVGAGVTVKLTFPVNPRLPSEIVEFEELPARILLGVALLADIVKSGLTVIGTETV